MAAPGRTCPLHYRYPPWALARPAEIKTDILYVIGGVYGNRPALETILGLSELERGSVTLVFNGDFNWFNVDPTGFAAINQAVLAHPCLRGNVETELAAEKSDAGCGCAYPQWVDDATVERSNQIFQRLRETASGFPHFRKKLGALPMHMTAEVGGLRIGIVHGDAESLAGWRFSQEALADPGQYVYLSKFFQQAQVRIFACTHTCLPVLLEIGLAEGLGMIVNNGAAGMPNFRNTHYGVITRISTHPSRRIESLYGTRIDGVYVDALPVDYDYAAWQQEFLANWPPGSAAYESYYQRIVQGPEFGSWQVMRSA